MADSPVDRLNMYHHGTWKWQPTPAVIYQTAVDNLDRFRGSRGDQAQTVHGQG